MPQTICSKKYQRDKFPDLITRIELLKYIYIVSYLELSYVNHFLLFFIALHEEILYSA